MLTDDITDLRDTIVPKSDQLNADQLLAGPMTITITAVKRGATDEQPITIHYEGEAGRPYKPCKSMRRVLMFAWGTDGSQWIGRSITLFNRTDVKFGGQEVGGIRISHLSDIDRDISVSLTTTRGKKEPVRIKRLDVVNPVTAARARLTEAARGGIKSLRAAWGSLSPDLRAAIDPNGCPDDLKALAAKHEQPTTTEPADDAASAA